MLCIQAGHASFEPVNKHLATTASSNTPAQQNFNLANPKLSLSTHMSSVTLPEAPAATPQEERDELLVAARAQPSQNHSDLGAAGAKAGANNSATNSDAAPNTETVMAAATVEKTYKQENNYLLALALILLTGSIIAYVLFSKRQ